MKTLARASDRAEVLRRLRSLRAASERRWGRMTAHQMVCHLADSFRLAMGEKPSARGPSVIERTIVKWVALYVPIRWPPGIHTTPEIDQELGGTKPADFEADVAQVEGLVDLVTAETRAFDWPLHPVLGRMSGAAWLRWGYLHTDHHLRQFGA